MLVQECLAGGCRHRGYHEAAGCAAVEAGAVADPSPRRQADEHASAACCRCCSSSTALLGSSRGSLVPGLCWRAPRALPGVTTPIPSPIPNPGAMPSLIPPSLSLSRSPCLSAFNPPDPLLTTSRHHRNSLALSPLGSNSAASQSSSQMVGRHGWADRAISCRLAAMRVVRRSVASRTTSWVHNLFPKPQRAGSKTEEELSLRKYWPEEGPIVGLWPGPPDLEGSQLIIRARGNGRGGSGGQKDSS